MKNPSEVLGCKSDRGAIKLDPPYSMYLQKLKGPAPRTGHLLGINARISARYR